MTERSFTETKTVLWHRSDKRFVAPLFGTVYSKREANNNSHFRCQICTLVTLQAQLCSLCSTSKAKMTLEIQ